MQTRLDVIIAKSGLSFFRMGVLGVFRVRRPGGRSAVRQPRRIATKVCISAYFGNSLILHLHDTDGLEYSLSTFEPKRPESSGDRSAREISRKRSGERSSGFARHALEKDTGLK
jgi:hypothetical protein